MSNNTVTIIFAIMYFVLILGIGWAAGKKTKNMADFMVGGRSLGVWITSLGIMAAVMSGWTWLGGSGATYANGYSGWVRFMATSPMGVIVAYYIVAKPVRIISERSDCLTLPDILAARWNNNKVIRTLSCLIIMIGSITYLVSQWTSMGTVLEPILGIDYKYCVLIGAVIITAYVITGGMLASMWTNFIQMIIMVAVALLIVVKSIDLAGGFTVMNQTVSAINPEFVTPFGPYGFIDVLSYGIFVVLLAYGGQPGVNTKFMMIKDRKELRWSPLISMVALCVGALVYFVGISGIVLVDNGTIAAPAKADAIVMSMVEGLFSPLVGSLIVVAIMAAVMSTAETHLFNSASSIVQDFLVKVCGMNFDDKKRLWTTRVFLGLVTVVTVILAMNPPAMISVLGGQAFGAFCAGFGPVLYLGMRWKRVNSKAAIAGMIVGLMGGILPIIDPGNTLMPGWTVAGVMTIASFAVTIIISLVTKPSSVENKIFEVLAK